MSLLDNLLVLLREEVLTIEDVKVEFVVAGMGRNKLELKDKESWVVN